MLPGVGVEISTPWRIALIPDVSVLNTRSIGACARPENLVLAAEVWSRGNSRTKRETKVAAYAGAGVPYFWVANHDRLGTVTVTAHRLENARYVEELTAGPGNPVTIDAAPVPVTLDPTRLVL